MDVEAGNYLSRVVSLSATTAQKRRSRQDPRGQRTVYTLLSANRTHARTHAEHATFTLTRVHVLTRTARYSTPQVTHATRSHWYACAHRLPAIRIYIHVYVYTCSHRPIGTHAHEHAPRTLPGLSATSSATPSPYYRPEAVTAVVSCCK